MAKKLFLQINHLINQSATTTKQINNRRQQTSLLRNPQCVLVDFHRWAKFSWNQCSIFGCYALAA